MLKKEDQLLYTVQPTQLNKLLCCFLDPSLMIQEQTAPHGDISNYNDPVYMLFNPNTKDSKITFVVCLCACVCVCVFNGCAHC